MTQISSDTISYTYGDSAWGDLLAAYDGQTITSDTIGNMLSDGTWTYSWEHGRELAAMSNGSTTWTYTYNADGLRTKRTNGTTSYEYIYNGSQLSQMTMNENGTVQTLYFAYDDIGPFAVSVTSGSSTATYYYVRNIQGDIIGIMNTDGTAVVQYTYDAWGNLLTTTGSMASTLGVHNPLRYRAYVYDTETSLYYLRSRYYNPAIGRFINADGYVATGQGILGNNMFAYCLNNPVVNLDRDGQIPSAVPVISSGLNLPPTGGLPVVIDGETFYYAIKYDHGDLHEYWFDSNGNLVWGRHHSDHRTPWKHDDPHDHQGGKDEKGNNTLVGGPKPVNSKFQPPQNITVDNDEEAFVYAVAGVAVGILVYQGIKWVAAFALAPATGGGSLAVAMIM